MSIIPLLSVRVRHLRLARSVGWYSCALYSSMKPRSLDFHKLKYFWHAARRGSLAAAARELRVAQPTVSTQVQGLEDQLQGLLFSRGSRALELTDLGKVVFRYADQIFELGAELERLLASGTGDVPSELKVGVADGVPKLVVRSLLIPAMKAARDVRVECREWRTDLLLADLAHHRMDLVVADISGTSGLPSRLLTYEAGASGIALLGVRDLTVRARRGFPQSLNGMPLLVPVRESPLRQALDVWLDANEVSPRIVAEVDDRALMNQLGQAGQGLFPAAMMLETELCRQFEVERAGILKGVRETYYVVTTRRRLKHPGVAAICKLARQQFVSATNESSVRKPA